LLDIGLVAPQSDRFVDPQALAIHHQDKQMIAHATASALRRRGQTCIRVRLADEATTRIEPSPAAPVRDGKAQRPSRILGV
jgi:hypothetical protein